MHVRVEVGQVAKGLHEQDQPRAGTRERLGVRIDEVSTYTCPIYFERESFYAYLQGQLLLRRSGIRSHWHTGGNGVLPL